MVPESERVKYHGYTPGWGCVTFSTYKKLQLQAAGLVPLSPGTLPALYELSRREYYIIDRDRSRAGNRRRGEWWSPTAPISDWLIAKEYPADLIGGSGSPVLHETVSGYFLSMESTQALFEFKLQWL
jgi:hypothetical protein